MANKISYLDKPNEIGITNARDTENVKFCFKMCYKSLISNSPVKY